MRLSDDFEESRKSSNMYVTTVLVVTLFIVLLITAVLFFNRDKGKSGLQAAENKESQESVASGVIYPEAGELISEDKLRPDDLDFWDKYPEESEAPVSTKPVESVEIEVVENDPSTDGHHTLIVNEKGEEEWLLISPYLPKHEYDFTNLVSKSGLMKYYEDGRLTSYVGVDLSKNQDYVDFGKVKKAGIEFAMIRLGSRGYGTGQLTLDEYFVDNVRRADAAGIKVGIYFFSQAISTEEAVEEANMVLEQIAEMSIDYPIAFDMKKISNDSARTDKLTKSERTKIAKAFLDTIKAAGYKAILYGNKEWLLKEIDYSKLTDVDVWLSQDKDIPDYPYRFTMWQYETQAVVDGISGYVNLDISFIDYSEK